MPKDKSDKRYLNPAIPRGSRLLAHLEQVSAETGIAESQLLVYFASEYVRLVVDGAGIISTAPAPHVSTVAVASGTVPEQLETQGNMRTLAATRISDENFDSFGDPD